MAAITTRNGSRTIQFIMPDSVRRKTIALGKMTDVKAAIIKERIEDLLTSKRIGERPHDETVRWVARLNGKLRRKLEEAGLIAPSQSEAAVTLSSFIDNYIAGRCDVKGSTATVYGHTRRNLLEHFGAARALASITEGDADEWRLNLMKQGLAQNTVRRRSGIAKQFFRQAVRKRLIASNPFADLKSTIQKNQGRAYFLSAEDAKLVIDACPDAQWRLIVALSRYGGLRCPSETLGLRWQDVDWERGRFWVRSPKTEHHEGHEGRWVPIFPQLRPYLLEVFEQAEDGATSIITRYCASTQNLRTEFRRILKRAGLTPWSKLFHNMRSTRETELTQRFPLHVVCAWLGNSQPVAAKHYLQVTDEHFEQASMLDVSAAQALQQGSEAPRIETQDERETPVEDLNSPECAAVLAGSPSLTDSDWATQDSNL